MSSPDQQAPAPSPAALPRVWLMYRALVGIGLFCGLAIVVAYEVTRPIIQRNRIGLLERAITEVLPGATSSAAFRMDDDGGFEPVPSDSEGDTLVYAGYDDEHRLVGLALRAQGMGYQDIVKILYGYSFEKDAILGISVLESRETPGLGDRIETDPAFLSNFGSLDVSLNADGTAPAHPIEFVKPGEKNADWQIDGISGATITSQATAEMLRVSSAYWIPRVQPKQAAFNYREGGGE